MFWDLIFSSYLEKVKIENNKKGNILWSISRSKEVSHTGDRSSYSFWISMAEAPPPPLQILARPYSPCFKA